MSPQAKQEIIDLATDHGVTRVLAAALALEYIDRLARGSAGSMTAGPGLEAVGSTWNEQDAA